MAQLYQGSVVVEQAQVAGTGHGAGSLGVDRMPDPLLTVEVIRPIAEGHPVRVVLRVHDEVQCVGV